MLSHALTGIRVVDFTTLLPGPLATLLLARAGADVLKIERPDGGDPMRTMGSVGGNRTEAPSVWFRLLNEGKQSLTVDLKTAAGLAEVRKRLATADVLVEQFRPGVMARLGLGPDELLAAHPRLVYCSISGYGQTGPRAGLAGHDLNYMADTGLLSLVRDREGAPVLPHGLMADIAGGAHPAVVQILMALLGRARTGRGCHLDIAMAAGLFPFAFWAIGTARETGRWPVPGGELFTGGSPRYQLYATKDGQYLAAAPLEPQFWAAFCEAIDLPAGDCDDGRDPAATRLAVAARIRTRTANEWMEAFAGRDVCCSIVRTLEEALATPEFARYGEDPFNCP